MKTRRLLFTTLISCASLVTANVTVATNGWGYTPDELLSSAPQPPNAPTPTAPETLSFNDLNELVKDFAPVDDKIQDEIKNTIRAAKTQYTTDKTAAANLATILDDLEAKRLYIKYRLYDCLQAINGSTVKLNYLQELGKNVWLFNQVFLTYMNQVQNRINKGGLPYLQYSDELKSRNLLQTYYDNFIRTYKKFLIN